MTKIATLTGHTYRVLYLAMSPDGSTIVTGAGDETLRFWQVFPDSTGEAEPSESQKQRRQDDIHCPRQLASLAAARRLTQLYTIR